MLIINIYIYLKYTLCVALLQCPQTIASLQQTQLKKILNFGLQKGRNLITNNKKNSNKYNQMGKSISKRNSAVDFNQLKQSNLCM